MTDPVPAGHSRSWIRRNIAPVAILIAVIPLLAFVVVGLPILDNAQREPRFALVEQGDDARSSGYIFTLTKSQEFVGLGSGAGGNSIPLGSALVAALVEITPDTSASRDDVYCSTELTLEVDGQVRHWAEVTNVDAFDYRIGDDRTSFCSLDGQPLSLEVVFLTPAGTYDAATLDLTIADDSFRFELVR